MAGAPRAATTVPSVAAGHPATVAAAAEVLTAGGNAFDAAVAAGFAAAVAEPVLSSLGGGGFLLARPRDGDEVLFDFFVDTPGRGIPITVQPRMVPVTLRFGAADQVFHVGHGSVAVPGCLAGYLHVHGRLGRLALDRVVAPAVRLAREGVALGAGQASVARLVDPILTLTAAGRRRFHPGGAPLTDDAVVTDPQLGDLIEAIGAGRVTGFDDPAIASRIEEVGRADGGLLTAADLAAYSVHERDPLVVSYRGARLATNPPPSSGATLIARALDAFARGAPAPDLDDPEALVRLVAALATMTRDPDAGPTATAGTTHVSIVDADGNLAAMTTSNGSGSGVHLGDTGVLANNICGEEDLLPVGEDRLPAGVRVGSMMAPSLLDRPGRPTVVFGSGGSERIRSALAQVVVRLVDEDRDLADAVLAPRVHLDTSGTVQVEPTWSDAAVAALADRWPVNRWSVSDLYFGGVHAVATDGQHVGDPRRGGASRRLDAVT
ncbi:gamma-glutamyltransferase [Nitriliruptor alkaliphilus]|uniref:gamma-glutamyltransferase n=1 Tax=Nitriliruptor alkaliphilus TaxID=427918 RepID=UPI00069844DA|nr:gamma-glutamyltransferase [Nitriliruptor alkaliphilus]